MPLQRYTVLFTSPPSRGCELILKDRENDESDTSDEDDVMELDADDAELLRIRGGGNGGELPPEAAALVKAAADKARTLSAASVKQQSEAISRKPAAAAAATSSAKQQSVPSVVAPHPPGPVITVEMTGTNTKRKRPTNVCISSKSPLFNAVQKMRKQHEFNIDLNILSTCNDEWMKSAIVNIIRAGTTIFKVEHKICPPKALPAHNRPIRKHINSRKTKRRSFPYFRSNHYRSIWLENKNDSAQEVNNILNNPAFYPVNVLFQRWVVKQNVKTDVCNPPRAKRLKTDPSAEATPQPKNGVICLFDSSDEDEEPDEPAKACNGHNQHSDELESTTASSGALPVTFTTSYEPPPDPAPPLLKYSDNADFVLTPYGAGKVISSRVERYTSISGNASLLRPTIIFTIDLHFGICHVPSHQVKTISGTPYVTKSLLTYNKVPITSMDLLRLRPMTYLNDSIVNFYLKYLKARTETGNDETVPSGRGWDDLDGNGVYIFPSFCYNQIVRIMSTGNDNKNTKANRQKIWNELKSWTKGTDIFKKRMLVFPINYNLHWTVLFVFHPGRLVRRYEKVVLTKEVPKSTPIISQDSAGGDVKTKSPERFANGLRQAFSGVVSAVKQSISNVASHISSPSRKQNDHATSEPDSNIKASAGEKASTVLINNNANHISSPSRKQTDQATSETDSNTKAVTEQAHEQLATSTRWQCDFCAASLATYEVAGEHEKRCYQNKEFCMLHFDSGKHFKLHDSQQIAGNVRKYLSAFYDGEYATTHPNVGALNQTNLPGYTSAVPQQDNTKDCGVYMLEVVERMLADPPTVDHEFVKKKCKVFAKNLFGKDVIEQKRDDILQLVHKLREGQDVS
ncbi:hypothetical protein ACHAWO_011704 [Cyclotella atomus]|uniref:Ubiquitin-like protease family profile domain-containing protein n=1 Tax=Cyclotella atomus TaxID=382360 RepID=A0ABD3PD50_9STRA